MVNLLKLIPEKFFTIEIRENEYPRKKLSLSGREDKKDITFKIPLIYFQNLIGYTCIALFVFFSKHVSN